MDLQVNLTQQIEVARQQQVIQRQGIHQQEDLAQKTLAISAAAEKEVATIQSVIEHQIEERESTPHGTPFKWKKRRRQSILTNKEIPNYPPQEQGFKDPYRGKVIDEIR